MAEPNPAAPGQPAEHPEAHAGVAQPEPGHSAPAKAFGLIDAPMFISLAMLAVIALIIAKKVPAAIGRALDAKIAGIREQLAEAETLRKDAEALKAEYAARAASAEQEAQTIVERARHEADAILAQARTDAEALVERRGRMAEEKIAAEERLAVEQLRADAAEAARMAAARLIAETNDAAADSRLVDQAIAGLSDR
jgi:F-type H+-transporting ATPase subunit b